MQAHFQAIVDSFITTVLIAMGRSYSGVTTELIPEKPLRRITIFCDVMSICPTCIRENFFCYARGIVVSHMEWYWTYSMRMSKKSINS